MRTRSILAALVPVLSMLGCSQPLQKQADLARIYNTAAIEIGNDRTPVVVIPGILGSKLEAPDGTKVWGAFTFGAADADTPEGARLVALPMQRGTPLSQLQDDVAPTEVLDVVVADVGIFRGLEFGAYVDILSTLAAGRFRDESLGEAGAVDYGGLHYTCFQLPYDWRRDISEQAAMLHEQILDAKAVAALAMELEDDSQLRVDVVAHSMGGMVLRYYLRYGSQSLPEDGSLPQLTWAGAQHVRKAVLIGTPNAGSVLALRQLVDGWDLNPLFPNYRPSVLGTMPAIYQLLPRVRHARIVTETGTAVDLYDPGVWERNGWGLVNPDEDDKLRELLPDVETFEQRHAVAFDHLSKCLAKAKQLHQALDVPASPPPGTTICLFAGDAEDTPGVFEVGTDGRLRVKETEPGDNTVTRSSALMDERTGREWQPFLQSPVAWGRVQFVSADHLGLTRHPSFADNLLFMLLEEPSR